MAKRGVSVLLAEVLLVGLAVSLIVLLVAFGKDMFKERSEEATDEYSASSSCNKIEFNVKKLNCNAGSLQSIVITNDGESKIYGFMIDDGTNIVEKEAEIDLVGVATVDVGSIPDKSLVKLIPLVKKGNTLNACGNNIKKMNVICSSV